MREFESQDSFIVTGRGRSFVVKCPVDSPRDDLMRTIGTAVKIDGVEYQVAGIESYCIPTIRKGMPISILVVDRDGSDMGQN